jgi:CDP-paratose 2-epimerase
MSLLELVAKLEAAVGRKLDPPFADWRPGDQRVFVANVAKAEKALGWKPKVTTDEGVDRLIAWVQANRDLFASN